MADLSSLKSDLRCVLLSEKNGIEISRLNSEFRDTTGSNIDYDRKQYNSLESFLRSLNDVCQIKKYGDKTMVFAYATDKQQGLKQLIQGQKSSNKKRGAARPLFSRRQPSSSSGFNRKVYVKRNTSYTSSSHNNAQRNTRYTNGNSNPTNDRKVPTVYYKNVRNVGSTRATTASLNDENQPPRLSNGKKVFDFRAAQNKNLQVIESKASDFSNHTDQNSNSNQKQQRTPPKSRSPYKAIETKTKIHIKEGEPGDFKHDLGEYCKEHNLPDPKYLTSNYVERNKVIAYFSKVQIGDRSWLIYPECCYRTAEGADCGVAKKALEELKQLEKNVSTTTLNDDILEKIANFFASDDPLYSHHVEQMFIETYASKLDDNWLDLVKQSNKFEVESIKVGNKTVVLIVLLKNQQQQQQQQQVKQSPIVNGDVNKKSEANGSNEHDLKDTDDNLANQASLMNLGENENDVQELPESLELNRDDDWQILVLRATNSREIVIRLTNNTNQLDELITSLHKYYDEDKLGKRVENVIINKIYAAVFDGAVFRVQTIIQEGNEVYCWFLDDGITEKISRSNLYEIDPKFMKLPFQAFTVQLDGLQDQSESLIRKFIDDKMKENDDSLCLIARPVNFDTDPITVRLFDTSNDDKDIDLNEAIIEYINTNPLPGSKTSIQKSILPKFNDDENEYEPMKVMVSYPLNPHNFIVTNIDHFQPDSKYVQLNNKLQEFYSKNEEHVDLNESMIYPGLFICVRDDNLKWYRGRVDDIGINSSKCTVYLVDEGRIILAEVKNIQPLYSQFLELPMIAIRASLANIVPINKDWCINSIVEFKGLVDGKEFNCLVQDVVSIDGETIMLVDLVNGDRVADVLVESQRAKLL